MCWNHCCSHVITIEVLNSLRWCWIPYCRVEITVVVFTTVDFSGSVFHSQLQYHWGDRWNRILSPGLFSAVTTGTLVFSSWLRLCIVSVWFWVEWAGLVWWCNNQIQHVKIWGHDIITNCPQCDRQCFFWAFCSLFIQFVLFLSHLFVLFNCESDAGCWVFISNVWNW